MYKNYGILFVESKFSLYARSAVADAEFGKIGGNLNQIARHLNQGGQQTAEIFKSLRQRLAEIYEMKYAVIKMAGNFTTAGQHSDNSKGTPHGDTETHSS